MSKRFLATTLAAVFATLSAHAAVPLRPSPWTRGPAQLLRFVLDDGADETTDDHRPSHRLGSELLPPVVIDEQPSESALRRNDFVNRTHLLDELLVLIESQGLRAV